MVIIALVPGFVFLTAASNDTLTRIKDPLKFLLSAGVELLLDVSAGPAFAKREAFLTDVFLIVIELSLDVVAARRRRELGDTLNRVRSGAAPQIVSLPRVEEVLLHESRVHHLDFTA